MPASKLTLAASNSPVDRLINRIMADLEALRELTSNIDLAGGADAMPPIGSLVLKASYTKATARTAKAEIDAAFEAGNITHDKRRGLKMLVTKRTKGWSAITRAA